MQRARRLRRGGGEALPLSANTILLMMVVLLSSPALLYLTRPTGMSREAAELDSLLLEVSERSRAHDEGVTEHKQEIAARARAPPPSPPPPPPPLPPKRRVDPDSPEAWRATRAGQAMLLHYQAMHKRMMEMAENGEERPRIIVHQDSPTAGLGNRIGALVSTFALALATDRALFVDWKGTPARTHPDGEELVGFPAVGELFRDPGFNWAFYDAMWMLERSPFMYSRLKVQEVDVDTDGGAPQLLCGNLTTTLRGDVISVKSWDYFLPILRANPSAAHVFRALGADAPGVLLRFLLRPITALQDSVFDTRDRDLGPGVFSLGVHIRRRGYNKITFAQMMGLFECAGRMALERSEGLPVVWFVASDTEEGFHIAVREAKRLGARAVRSAAPLDPGKMRSTTAGNQGALVDMWLLGECDEMVLSAGSTFGRAARQRVSKTSMVAVRLEGDDAQARAREARLRAAARVPGVGGGGGVRGMAEGQAECTTPTTRESCYFGWKNVFMGGGDEAAPGGSTPGRAGAAHWLAAMRVKGEAAACASPDFLGNMRRFHSDCSRS